MVADKLQLLSFKRFPMLKDELRMVINLKMLPLCFHLLLYVTSFPHFSFCHTAGGHVVRPSRILDWTHTSIWLKTEWLCDWQQMNIYVYIPLPRCWSVSRDHTMLGPCHDFCPMSTLSWSLKSLVSAQLPVGFHQVAKDEALTKLYINVKGNKAFILLLTKVSHS